MIGVGKRIWQAKGLRVEFAGSEVCLSVGHERDLGVIAKKKILDRTGLLRGARPGKGGSAMAETGQRTA
jgi:hypothetical protein